jgi:hypothetical protein
MQWQFVVLLSVAIPIILFPVAFVWYMNLKGIYEALRGTRAKKVTGREAPGHGTA